MPETRQYELVYVISPEVDEDGVSDLHTQVADIVSSLGGQIDKTDNWGRRRLAYEIDKHREATYVVENFTGPGELVKELDRKLKVLDSVLRHLIVRVDEDLRKAEHARQKRQARQRSRPGPGMASPVTPAPSDSATETVAENEPDVPAASGAATETEAEVKE